MLEFALITPIFFLIVFSAFEFGLLAFGAGSAVFAASDAARVEAVVGNQAGLSACDAVCTSLTLGQDDGKGNKVNCDADCQAIVAINKDAVVTSSMVTINEIDIFHITIDSAGKAQEDTTKVRRLKANGQVCTPAYTVTYPNGSSRTYCSGTSDNYAPSSRNVTYGSSDFLEVKLYYTYNWKTGLMNVIYPEPPQLISSYIVRLEPSKF